MARGNGDQVRDISHDGRGGSNRAEGDGGPDDGARDGEAEDEDEQRGVHGDPVRAEPAEVPREGQHAVPRDGKGHALRRHEAAGRGAGRVEPEEDQEGRRAVRADQLHQVLGPVVGVACRDYAVEVLHAEEDHDQRLRGGGFSG